MPYTKLQDSGKLVTAESTQESKTLSETAANETAAGLDSCKTCDKRDYSLLYCDNCDPMSLHHAGCMTFIEGLAEYHCNECYYRGLKEPTVELGVASISEVETGKSEDHGIKCTPQTREDDQGEKDITDQSEMSPERMPLTHTRRPLYQQRINRPLYQRRINEAKFTGQNTVKNIEAAGDALESKVENTLRIAFQNVHGASDFRGWEAPSEIEAMEELEIDIMGMAETNRPWSKQERALYDAHMMKWFRTSRTIYTAAPARYHVARYQPGGNLLTINGEVTARITDRWTRK